MGRTLEDVIRRAQQWLAHDPDADTRSELEALIAAGGSELAERFSGPLAFGTAGLRGIIGAGETRMNRAVVRRTSHGLGRYLLEHEPDAAAKGVVVGYDGRRLSLEFAQDTAQVLMALGLKVHLSTGLCPTPIVAYAVNAFEAAAGVMVTASHNPPKYNGYKVYASNGAQIIPPTDGHIAEAIAAAPEADAIELAALAGAQPFDCSEAYLSAIAALIANRPSADRSLDIVYTPLHGVGAPLFERTMGQAGFDNVHVVAEQREPDGAFPTVEFPNPEEPGALDLALALADKTDATLLLANDPDADRLAAAVLSGGEYVQLTGNELGVLLGHDALRHHALRHRALGHQGLARAGSSDALVLASLVSSPWLGKIAAALGARYEETLTGFKWIANRAMQIARDDGPPFVFGYEEALGYTIGTVVRDKDGISAALVLACLAAELRAKGETLLDELERIARQHGFYASHQHSLRFPGSSGKQRMSELMNQLRSDAPNTIAGHDVIAVSDLQEGVRRASDGTSPIALPKSNVLVFDLDGGHRIIARPSGTEPKLKIYFDVREPFGDGDSLTHAKARANDHIAALKAAMLTIVG